MKVIHTPGPPERKLVAVIGNGGGVFLEGKNGGGLFIGSSGVIIYEYDMSLKDLAKGFGRTPVYEGDSVTLKF